MRLGKLSWSEEKDTIKNDGGVVSDITYILTVGFLVTFYLNH